MHAGENLNRSNLNPRFVRSLAEIDHRDRTPVRDMPDWIYPHTCATSGGPCQRPSLGPPSTPVADINFLSREHHLIWGHPDVPRSPHLAGGRTPRGDSLRTTR